MPNHLRMQSAHQDDPSSGRLPDVRVEHPLTLVIFGGTGDLTRRKLLPALHALDLEARLPREFRIVAFGRRDYDDASFQKEMHGEIRQYQRKDGGREHLDAFVKRISYFKGELDDPDSFARLAKQIGDNAWPQNRVFYLSTAPGFFGPVISQLKQAGLIHAPSDDHWSRVVIEKPFGHDLESALELNRAVLRLLD